MRNLLFPINRPYFIESVDGRTETPMHTKYFVINNSSESKVVKYIGAVSPNVEISVFPQASVIEAIDLSNLSAFMITSNKCDSFRVSYFQSEE